MAESDGRLNYRRVRSSASRVTETESESRSEPAKCEHCGGESPAGSRFCANCGHALAKIQDCPQCHAHITSGADICERCGTWILRGQCKFCLSEVAEDASFCGECGNPQAGIICPKCGSLSIFDFCKRCDIPLSQQGREQVAIAKADPAHKGLLASLQELVALDEQTDVNLAMVNPSNTVADAVKEQLIQMRRIRERTTLPTGAITEEVTQRAELFNAEQRAQIALLESQVQAEEERKRVEAERLRIEAERRRKEQEKRRRRILEEAMRVLHEMSAKTFSSNQEARRHFMSILSALPEEVRQHLTCSGSLRWRCNYANVEHGDPNECGDPSQGGVWLIR